MTTAEREVLGNSAPSRKPERHPVIRAGHHGFGNIEALGYWVGYRVRIVHPTLYPTLSPQGEQQKARRLEMPPGFAVYVAPGIERKPFRAFACRPVSVPYRRRAAVPVPGAVHSLPGAPAFFVPIWHTLNVPIWH